MSISKLTTLDNERSKDLDQGEKLEQKQEEQIDELWKEAATINQIF
jgi:hypothetical protein